MQKLKHTLLSPRFRTAFFVAGWLIVATTVLLAVTTTPTSVVIAIGAFGLALLATANSLAVRAALWRSQSNFMTIKRHQGEKLRNLELRHSAHTEHSSVLLGRIQSQLEQMANKPATPYSPKLPQNIRFDANHMVESLRTMFPTEPCLANYLSTLLQSDHDRILLVGDFDEISPDSLHSRIDLFSKLAGINITLCRLADRKEPLWNVRKYQRIALLPSKHPRALIPFSWVDSRTELYYLGAEMSEDFLQGMNFGIPVGFGWLSNEHHGIEFKVRRAQG
ncbi:hypothetical protein QP868_06220 [Brevibacterium sp. UMB1308A]|uniref:hypothetical protein n=1 Tax=Brevibacterium sp. UMB1308A TaxID=3050608 RepID=UPI00254B3805|nr:hypothetical protein [Brevibacterium sp. UMB1308A]MDK8346584.1 hypothetical protein [Brevibacterium sp. UMB1308B]MDK8713493.1 hypothetical protein [Brevibacterium sp. UMB1308A]